MKAYDAIVVGLGPAGATAARGLAGRGLSVLGLDKEKFPRYKSCGGCISTKIDSIIDFDFSDVVEQKVGGITFHFKSSRSVDIRATRPIAYNVDRTRFDALLVERARLAGAKVVEGERVNAVRVGGELVEIETGKTTYRGRFVIGADGASGVVGRSVLGLDYKDCHVSMTAEAKVSPAAIESLKGRCVVDFGSIPHGYAWIFPKKDHLAIGIAGLNSMVRGDVRRYFNEFVDSSEMLRDGSIEHVKGWTIPVHLGKSRAVRNSRVIVAGDAGHMVDPFIGEGIYYAVRSGQLAAKAVNEALEKGPERLADYERMVEEEFYPDFKANEGLVKLIYAHPRLWYRAVELEPGIMERYYEVLRGERSAKEFYGDMKRKIIKKPWKLVSLWLKAGLGATGARF